MSIRAKMVCSTITKDAAGNESVCCYPVTSGSDENKQWSKWTPGGRLELSISNPDAQGQFVPGKEYFVDVAEVPAAAPPAPPAAPPAPAAPEPTPAPAAPASPAT